MSRRSRRRELEYVPILKLLKLIKRANIQIVSHRKEVNGNEPRRTESFSETWNFYM